MGKRLGRPVKLSRKQLDRISRDLEEGFRMEFPRGGTYYFCQRTDRCILVYTYGGESYCLGEATLARECIELFFNTTVPRMRKLGWIT